MNGVQSADKVFISQEAHLPVKEPIVETPTPEAPATEAAAAEDAELEIPVAVKRTFGFIGAVGMGAAEGYVCYWVVRGIDKLGFLGEAGATVINPVAFVLSGMMVAAISELGSIIYDISLVAIGDRATYELLEITEESQLLDRFRRHSWKVISKVEKMERDIDVIYSRLFNVRTEQELKAAAVQERDLLLMEVARRAFAAQVYETLTQSVPQELGVFIVEAIGYTVVGGGQLLWLHGAFFLLSFSNKITSHYNKIEKEDWEEYVKIRDTVKADGLELENVPEDLKNKQGFVRMAVKQNGLALQFASPKLRKDRVVVLEAMKQNHEAFAFVDEELKKDENIVAAKEKFKIEQQKAKEELEKPVDEKELAEKEKAKEASENKKSFWNKLSYLNPLKV